MAKPMIAISVVAITLSLSFLLLLLHLSFSLRRRRNHPPYPLETPSLSPPNLSPPKLSPFYAHGVLSAPKRFLLSSPKLEAMLQPPPPRANANGSFICISNPVFDAARGGSRAAEEEEEDGERSPELKVMKKLPLKAVPAPAGWESASETNRASFSSEELCFSPSW